MSIKINKLEIENVKRVKAVTLEPSPSGLTIIGGNNRQGKSSVLDSIAWALGGNKFRPSKPQREGSVLPPSLKITLNNGLIIERKGKNSELKVTDPTGKKAGQQLLDTFVEELALNLPRFMDSSSKEKANILLQIIGVGPQLYELEQKETEIYNRRTAIGQIAGQKKKFADEQKSYDDVPKELVSASELIQQQQAVLLKNAENQKQRNQVVQLANREEFLRKEISSVRLEIERLTAKLNTLNTDWNNTLINLETAKKSTEVLQDESTAELEKNLREIEILNAKIRANLDKEKAEKEAKQYSHQYTELTAKIEAVRQQKIDLLKGAKLPLEGLSVIDGELIYQGFKWDNLANSDQLKVATAIVRHLRPECGFVLMDKLEAMDMDTLYEFGKWLQEEGLQVIATRVSKGEECSIIIEDGYSFPVEQQQNLVPGVLPKWKAGEF